MARVNVWILLIGQLKMKWNVTAYDSSLSRLAAIRNGGPRIESEIGAEVRWRARSIR